MVTRWVISFGLALFIWADAPIFRWPGLNSRVMILGRCLVLSPPPVSQLRKEIARRMASAAPTILGMDDVTLVMASRRAFKVNRFGEGLASSVRNEPAASIT